MMDSHRKVIQVDSYDFFGYLIPGFVVFSSICVGHLITVYNKSYSTLFADMGSMGSLQTAWIVAAVVVTAVAAYILGHAVASIASFFYEKLIIKYIFGYPYEILVLNKPPADNINFRKSLTVLTYTLIASIVLFQTKLWDFAHDESCVNFLVASSIVVTLSYALLNVDTVSRLVAYPFIFFEKIVFPFVGDKKPLPQTVRNLISRNFRTDFGISIEDSGSDAFWAIYWKVTNDHIYVRSKVDKWLVLYSFMRNIGAALLLSSLILSVANIIGKGERIVAAHSIILFLLSLAFVLRYYYLYYSYYSKQIFRAYAYLRQTGISGAEE